MLQLLKRFILFLSITATLGFLPYKAKATHLAGSDISYTCVGGNSYRIDLTFYRDCLGSQAPLGVGIEFRSVSCNQYFTDTILLVSGSGQEITYPCPGLSTACDDPTSPNPGIQEYHYSGIVNFPMFCSDWDISWQYCCRNCDITTMVVAQPCVPGANPAMHISTRLDNLNFNCNSSPHFTNNPIVFICVGQSFTYNHGAIDPDGDSLAYSLVDPLINATNPIPYLPGYSATVPINSTPALTIDPVTGDLNMTPTQTQVGVLSVLVEEYRNGVLVGHVVRDMEIYVRPCNNNIPTATGINGTNVRDTTVCPGDSICFDVFSNDIDSGQIVTMSWNSGIVNGTYSISGFPFPTGHFCWTPTIADISANAHQFTVTVIDNACPNSGYQTYSFNIYVNSPLMNFNVTDISCHGLQDGSIVVTPVNAGGYSYLWNPGGSTSSSITNLSAGNYDVTIYDSTTGCQATFPHTITDPPQLADSAFAITASCSGANSGIATVIASGGTPGYTYSWNTIPPTLSDTASGLAPGTYQITVTDSRGCSVLDSVVINTSSTAISVTVDSVSTLSCFTDTTGIAMISFSGGTPGYTIVWNTTPTQTGTTATGLSPGTYNVTITDTLGCATTQAATIGSPPIIAITGNSIPASCNASDGTAIASVNGGVPPYTYSWAGYPGNTTDSLPNVPVGVYDVTVTDSNGCVMTQSIVVGSSVLSTTASATAPAGCTGGANGVAVATVSGGTPPYSFSWNTLPPQLNDTATGLTPGTYVVTIVDSNNCTAVDTAIVPNPTNLSVSVTPVQISCSGDSSSIATASASGGVAPYSYSWSPYGGTTATADSLAPGTYIVTVTDSAGCVQQGSITIGTSSTIVITPDSTTLPSCYGANDGSIFVTVSGGAGGFSYSWNPGGATSEDLSGIDAGVYTITVTDASGCTQQQQLSLSQPSPVPADAGPDTAICAGASIQLQAVLAAGSTGLWSSSTGITFSDPTDPHATASNVPGGNNVLTWTVTNASGCIGVDFVTIFNYNFSAGQDVIQCNLNQVQLNGTIGTGFTGLWTWVGSITLNDPTLNNATVTIIDYGVDTLTWTVSNPACSSSDQVVIAAYQQPTAEAGDTQTVCIGQVILQASNPGVGVGVWTVRAPSQATFADSLDPFTTASGLDSNVTTVFVWTVSNNVCAAADTVAIFYDPSCELVLPNGFSPNGDGLNDGYLIRGIEAYPINIFRVFNRWGNEVYTKENYQNTDWIGQNNNGDDLPEGTYFVILEVKNANITKHTYVDLRRFRD